MPVADSPEHVVVAGLLRRAGRALLVHRSPSRRWYPDVWDLPGGHVRAGERPARAVERELGEELGITVTVSGEPFAEVRGTDYRMTVWVLDRWDGEPVNRAPHEHDAVAWFGADDVGVLRLADPQLPQLVRAALGPLRSTGRTRGAWSEARRSLPLRSR